MAARALEVGYGGPPVLRELSFEVRRGEIFGIMGGSGCGKSTLMKCLVGLLAPSAGEVELRGRDLWRLPLREREQLQRSIGVLFQGGALWSSMTVRENVALPLEEFTALNRAERERLVRLKLELVGMADAADKFPSELSGGMRKRAALARALALDPDLLFFDEPSAGLDPVTARRLDELILRTCRLFGTTIVVVSHELGSLFRIADRILYLDVDARGAVALGTPEELRRGDAPPSLKAFLESWASPGHDGRSTHSL
ncbi:MAG: ATP-binding cassette domain-containing protein [Puniceicoccaceae bacterium]|nr:MAG: ATP-binding cassette domain-containing protein [Puniceicoccaceae bacterium]